MYNKQILKKVIQHRKADEIKQGKYWENGKGCCIGCIAETSDKPHEKAAGLLGIPLELAHLADVIFEGLPNGEAKLFPERFVKSIHIGKDYSLVGYKFKLFLNKTNLALQKKQAKKHPELKKEYDKLIPSIEQVIVLLKKASNGKDVTKKEWSAAAWSARSSAWSAESAAWSARSSAWSAESAARSAAWSAESAAWSSVRSAAAWSARSSADSASYKKMADYLISLLEKTKDISD